MILLTLTEAFTTCHHHMPLALLYPPVIFVYKHCMIRQVSDINDLIYSFKTKGNLTKHMKSKAHYKKCMEMGIDPVPTIVDDSYIDEECLARQVRNVHKVFMNSFTAKNVILRGERYHFKFYCSLTLYKSKCNAGDCNSVTFEK